MQQDRSRSRLGRNAFDLDRILAVEPDFLDEGHQHDHNEDVTSISLVGDRPLVADKFFKWLQYLTQSQGADILRIKGILDMQGEEQRFVVQGLHMLLEGDRQRPWKASEKRQSRLVFIGRNLDRAVLEAGFQNCKA